MGFWIRRDHLLTRILERLDSMATTLAQLDAAIAAETTEDATLLTAVTAVQTDITNLLAKIAAGTPVDVTSELTAVNANLATVTGAVTNLQAADAAANPPAAPPAA